MTPPSPTGPGSNPAPQASAAEPAARFDASGAYLAMDTATPLGSVVAWQGGEVVSRAFLATQGEHASRLIPAIGICLAEAGLTVDDLDGLVVGQGPGSFTGVRVAVATAKGLVAARGFPLWAFSSLEAGAASGGALVPDDLLGRLGDRSLSAPDPTVVPDISWASGEERADQPICVLFDARGDRVYAGAYRFSEDGWTELLEPIPSTMGEILRHPLLPPDTLFAGDGALRHAGSIRMAGFAVLPAPAGVPTAEGLMRLLSLRPDTPPVEDPRRWEPTYLRGTSARPMAAR